MFCSENSVAKPVFGMPLEQHLRLMGRDISLVLEACILTLLETGMEEEVSNNNNKVKSSQVKSKNFNHPSQGNST